MSYKGGKLSNGTPLNVAVYQAYRNAGLSHNQSLAITSEVGRENGFQSGVLFGNHTDPAANSKGQRIRNLGMLSWNQGRDNRLESYLNKSGVMRGGVMARTQENLNAQARFSVSEMKGPTYAGKLKNFWANPNASPDSFAKDLGKHYIAWAYGQNTIRANGGGRKAFNWKSHDNRRRGYLNDLNGMTGGKGSFSPQSGGYDQPAPDPRLSMSMFDLTKNIRGGKTKRSDNDVFIELANNNGLAGQQVNHLIQQGIDPKEIARQLGLTISVAQPPQPQAIAPPSFEDFAANYSAPVEAAEPPSFDDFSASYEQEQPIEPTEPPSFEQFAASYEPTEQPTQTGEPWQTQNELSETTLSPKSEKAQPMQKSSWESLS